ncbi:hypothetical protein ACRYCC_25150 [Actinomadura scrupuli]|uniref:hypothetical protein n=1 Tax=Actinomadura scrupuli TaxID=559629 RepID=UPI003D9647E7
MSSAPSSADSGEPAFPRRTSGRRASVPGPPAGPARRGTSGGLLVATGAVIVLLIMLPSLLDRMFTLDQSDVHGAADAAAYELERTPVKGLGLYSFDIQRALAQGTRGRRGSLASELRVESAGADSRGDLYQITNSDGDHPVCLAVRVDIALGDAGPSFPTTSVTDGRCRPA